jgi:hypothetical protein
MENFKKVHYIKPDGTYKTFKRYEVNERGEVKNIDTDYIKVHADNGKGYKFVSLWENGIEYHCYIHRIIASTFITDTTTYETVDHINRDRSDNSIHNLRWATYSENNNNMCEVDKERLRELGKKMMPIARAKADELNRVKVQVEYNGKVEVYPSMKDAGIGINLDDSAITRKRKGRTEWDVKSHKHKTTFKFKVLEK